MKEKNRMYVKYNDQIVGVLAMTDDKKIAFQYSEEWIKNGFSINPFALPLKRDVFIPSKNYFDGLFGVFADSLPDSWGSLLLDRFLQTKNIRLQDITMLDRLAMIGANGIGALTYEPEIKYDFQKVNISLDDINEECGKILESIPIEKDILESLFILGGSSGGARPKVMIEIEGKHWIVKISNHIDSPDSGKIEFDYFKCAKKCGINVPETKLFSSKKTAGYFGIERFDRIGNKKIHSVSVSGLLDIDYRAPSLDYNELLKLTKIITNDVDTYEMFRRMCFNVFSHNLDDHSKNFSFLYLEDINCWRLSPAYDLTYSDTYFGEHTTSVNGKAKENSDDDLLKFGINNHLNQKKSKEKINNVKTHVNEMLSKYLIK